MGTPVTNRPVLLGAARPALPKETVWRFWMTCLLMGSVNGSWVPMAAGVSPVSRQYSAFMYVMTPLASVMHSA